MNNANKQKSIVRARAALEGTALGDAYGQTLFIPEAHSPDFDFLNHLPAGTWPWTDDTAMAISVYECLEKHGEILQDELASSFAARYANEPNRGYGPAMHRLMHGIVNDMDWKTLSRAQFGGQGSWGNGSAMRVAPIGAYFAEDFDLLADQAAKSAEITHANEEGIAGAIAMAMGAGWAARKAMGEPLPDLKSLLLKIASAMPDSVTRDIIRRAALLPDGSSVQLAVSALGNGSEMTCQDTVPYVLWCAFQHLDNFEIAVRYTASGGGDIDTTCAMVGGIVALTANIKTIPRDWIDRVEPLPDWIYLESDEGALMRDT